MVDANSVINFKPILHELERIPSSIFVRRDDPCKFLL